MINEMFPIDEASSQVDATLDLVAIKVSLDLINDVPAKDPRWADVKSLGMMNNFITIGNTSGLAIDENCSTEKVNLNSTLSLQIQSQLEEKQQALDWFISFLREMGLWNRVSFLSVTGTGTVDDTLETSLLMILNFYS